VPAWHHQEGVIMASQEPSAADRLEYRPVDIYAYVDLP
jgi:hypothetical protein